MHYPLKIKNKKCKVKNHFIMKINPDWFLLAKENESQGSVSQVLPAVTNDFLFHLHLFLSFVFVFLHFLPFSQRISLFLSPFWSFLLWFLHKMLLPEYFVVERKVPQHQRLLTAASRIIGRSDISLSFVFNLQVFSGGLLYSSSDSSFFSSFLIISKSSNVSRS